MVAVGGDGTINEVLDGAVQSGRPDLRMGVLYSGTSPDFCRFHGIPVNPAAALHALVRAESARVDVARIEYRDRDGAPRTAHFGCGCNIGLGASVARFANRVRRRLGDGLGTGLAVIRALLRTEPVDLELDIDGQALPLPRVNNLSILKNPWIASGLKLDLGLRPDDGKLAVVAVHGKSPLGLCALLPGFYTGKAAASGSVWRRDCARVRVRAAREQEVEFDGDPRGFLPVDIRILPRALTLIGGAHERV